MSVESEARKFAKSNVIRDKFPPLKDFRVVQMKMREFSSKLFSREKSSHLNSGSMTVRVKMKIPSSVHTICDTEELFIIS